MATWRGFVALISVEQHLDELATTHCQGDEEQRGLVLFHESMENQELPVSRTRVGVAAVAAGQD